MSAPTGNGNGNRKSHRGVIKPKSKAQEQPEIDADRAEQREYAFHDSREVLKAQEEEEEVSSVNDVDEHVDEKDDESEGDMEQVSDNTSICRDCKVRVEDEEEGLCCDICMGWFHINSKCQNVQRSLYNSLNAKGATCNQVHWYCSHCNRGAANMLTMMTRMADSVEKNMVTINQSIKDGQKELSRKLDMEMAGIKARLTKQDQRIKKGEMNQTKETEKIRDEMNKQLGGVIKRLEDIEATSTAHPENNAQEEVKTQLEDLTKQVIDMKKSRLAEPDGAAATDLDVRMKELREE